MMLTRTSHSDIASFYKEELADEIDIYVRERATASGNSVRAVLHDMVGEAATAVRAVESMLHGVHEKDIWRAFVDGYFYFHVCCGRYRLDELGFF